MNENELKMCVTQSSRHKLSYYYYFMCVVSKILDIELRTYKNLLT